MYTLTKGKFLQVSLEIQSIYLERITYWLGGKKDFLLKEGFSFKIFITMSTGTFPLLENHSILFSLCLPHLLHNFSVLSLSLTGLLIS